MTRWVALLRGVNVGGVTIRSVELAEVFRALGFTEVKTVLASGNVVFSAGASADTAPEDAAELKPRIEAALSERFGYQAWVQVLSADALARIVAEYPFEEAAELHAYVIFLMDEGPRELLALAPQLDAPERLADGGAVLYWRVAKGNTLGSVIGKASAAPRFRAQSTTRNLRTLRKLLG